jgi:hypothetical protein
MVRHELLAKIGQALGRPAPGPVPAAAVSGGLR